jgi:plastocyanin
MVALAVAWTGSGAWACLVPNLETQSLEVCPPCGSEAAIPMLNLHEPQGVEAGVGIALLTLPGAESVVNVHVLNFDYSVNAAGPVVDPVITAGDTVHWIFDTAFHSVTSVAGSAEVFDSGVLFTPGATFDRTFNTPGTYEYFCTVHGFDNGNGTAGAMSGVVTVLPVPEPGTALMLAASGFAMRRRR